MARTLCLAALLVMTIAGPAFAHPGHAQSGFLHPLTGADHLLAMVGAGASRGGPGRWVRAGRSTVCPPDGAPAGGKTASAARSAPFGHVRSRGDHRYLPAVMPMIVTIRIASPGLRIMFSPLRHSIISRRMRS